MRNILLLIFLLVPIPGSACNGGTADPYQTVPLADRKEFVSAVERCIALTKTRDWKRLYGQLDQTQEKTSEKEFVKKMKGLNRLVNFSVRSVYYIPPAEAWSVHGCALYDPHVDRMKTWVQASFMVRRTEQGWRTSAIGIVMDMEDPTGIGRCEELAATRYLPSASGMPRLTPALQRSGPGAAITVNYVVKAWLALRCDYSAGAAR